MGNNTINNFDPLFPYPLDNRTVVNDIAARDALVTDGVVYEGIIAYIKDDGADKSSTQQYTNVGTVLVPDLQWVAIGGGAGGTSIHNDLQGIQGGISNTEHYHLNQRQFDWVEASVPFVSPAVNLSSNKGPTWAWNTDLSTQEPIVLSGSIIINEGLNCRIRLWDTGAGVFLVPDTGGQDANGYVAAPANAILTFTFPAGVYPVDTSQVNGDTHAYRCDILYDDLDGATDLSKSKNLTYTAQKRNIDEIWISPIGEIANPISNPPALATMDDLTQVQAANGYVVDLATPAYVVFCISNDLTGGDPSRIVIKQNGVVVYQFGTPNDQGFNMTQPYSGDKAASADPNVDFTQISSTAYIGNQQTYVIEIL